MITRKNWYKKVRRNDWSTFNGKKFQDYDVTYSSSPDLSGVHVHISTRGLSKTKYYVTTSGHYMYTYNKEFNTLKQAEDYALKIMKYYDYGRLKLKVVDNS